MNSNFRYRLVNLSLLVYCAFHPWTTFSQMLISNINSSELTENQIAQLERISNAHSQLFARFHKQLSDNQNDIDLLRGQIQENQYQLDRLTEQHKQILLEIDKIRNDMSSLFSTSNQKKDIANIDLDAHDTDYHAAITLVQDRSREDDAILAFEEFIKKYPNSAYQLDANYCLGQLNYNRGREEEAVFYFSSVLKRYPESQKAPDAMFKIGIIMQDKGDIVISKAIYNQLVTKYPGTEGAKQAKKRLNSMK